MMFSFGEIDLTPYIFVTDVNRSLAPSRRIERTEIPGRNGELVRANGLEALEITVEGTLYPNSIDQVSVLRRLLARMLMSYVQPLRLPDEPWTYLLALYQGGAELSRHAHQPRVELEFICPDPVAYGQDRIAQITGSRYVEAGGTYPAYPIVTVQPPEGSSWQITNVDTGAFVRIYADFVGTQTLTLNMGLQRCQINNTDHAVDVASDFFALDGRQQIMVSGGMATLTWNERWL